MFKELLQLITTLTIIITVSAIITSLQQNFQGVEYILVIITICILLVLWASVIRFIRF